MNLTECIDAVHAGGREALEAAALFCSGINQRTGDDLEKHGFSREETLSGLKDVYRIYD